MYKLYLEVKCECLYWLMHFNIIPKVWHKCELKLAKIKAAELAKQLNWKYP